MTIPAVRRGSCLVSATKAVRATEPLTRLIACSVADRVLEDLSAAVSPDRVDSELAMIHAFAEHGDVDVEVSASLCAVLLHAQEAARLSGGLVDPVVGVAIDAQTGHRMPVPSREPYRLDADRRRLFLRRGTVLDLWNIGCAWAAEEIVGRVSMEDPAASLAVVVGPSVVAVGAAWEISEALDCDLTVLDPALRCGLRSFAVFNAAHPREGQAQEHPVNSADVEDLVNIVSVENTVEVVSGADAQRTVALSPAAGQPWWDKAAVGADDAVQALTFGLMAERLGDDGCEHIVRAGGEAEFEGPRGDSGLRRLVRTPGWMPRGL